MPPPDPHAVDRAARALAAADALVVAAGAGMGVDSGLPDFRGDAGFWNAYPPYAHLGLRFVEMANPALFARDAALAWGFYGHRLHLYRDTAPHPGFAILRRWVAAAPRGAFVFTSNVDGQFQRAGFPEAEVVECHGSIHHLQCARPCDDAIWSAAGVSVAVDPQTMRARGPLPACPRCGGLARPNVLMFGDFHWNPDRTAAQEERFADWLEDVGHDRLAILEVGAGTAVPTVRYTTATLARRRGATLVRINVAAPEVPAGHIGIPSAARVTLEAIDRTLARA